MNTARDTLNDSIATCDAIASEGGVRDVDGRIVVTVFRNPPIPDRRWDWYAYFDATYDGEGHIGEGSTEQGAIDDLFANEEE